jgi:nicotinamidase-related amidase
LLIDTDQIPVRRIAKQEQLPSDKTALLIVDMMNRFCDPAWLSQGNESLITWYRDNLSSVIPATKLALDAFRSAHALVVHMVTGKWTNDGRDLVPYMRGRDYDYFDTPGMSVIAPLEPIPGEITIRKSASSAFTGTGLDFLLHNAGIEHLALCGQFGNACLFYSLIQSREYGFRNYWIEDAVLYGNQISKDLLVPLIGAQWAVLTSARQLSVALHNNRQK